MVPQPLGNVAPAPAPTASSTPLVPNQNSVVPPGHKWVLVADSSPATIPPASAPPTPLEVVNIEPEPVKVDAELKTAQAAVDKMQCIIESALMCLNQGRDTGSARLESWKHMFQHTALRYWPKLPPWPQSLFLAWNFSNFTEYQRYLRTGCWEDASSSDATRRE